MAGNRRRKHKDKTMPKKKNHTFVDNWNRTRDVVKEPHAGSYAHPKQQSLVGGSDLAREIQDAEEDLLQQVGSKAKRNLVFLLAYLGTDYGGFQINEGQRSVQAEFELALFRAKRIHPRNFGFPTKYAWSTSGRTDKGVHACAQVVSCKVEMDVENETVDDVRVALNQRLSDSIRVLDTQRVTRSFNAHTQRDRVRYQYMIPAFAFCDREKLRDLFDQCSFPDNKRPAGDPLTPEEVAFIRKKIKDTRVTSAQLERLQKALNQYQGTQSYHNFSKGVAGNEDRAKRYIISFQVEEPMIFEDGTQWIPTQVLGQSFLVHQIRKMVSLAVDIGRGIAPVSTIPGMFRPEESERRVNIAPAQGLFMEMSYYGGYNERKDRANPDLDDLKWHEPGTPVYERWKDFRNNRIMTHIVEEEAKEGNFVSYLYIQEKIFDFRKYYCLDGDANAWK